MKEINFARGGWEDFFNYAYTERFPFAPKFIQEAECISNGRNDRMSDGFDYTTIMTKERYGKGTKISVSCSFESYGAPLITLTDTLTEDDEGNLRYGVCQEIVLWEDGINVWNFFVEDGELKWNKILASKFSVEAGVKQELGVELLEKAIRITAGDNELYLRVEQLPCEVYLGITGCENINRIYSARIFQV